MIKYQLACDSGHEFEAWFASMDAFDRQTHRGLVNCPDCPSNRIEKRPMAPAIVSKAKSPKAVSDVTTDEPPVRAIAPRETASKDLIDAMRALKSKVLENSEHVGRHFAEEARRIHFGETEIRSIHGEASLQDAHELHEDGIAFGILPRLPDEQN